MTGLQMDWTLAGGVTVANAFIRIMSVDFQQDGVDCHPAQVDIEYWVWKSKASYDAHEAKIDQFRRYPNTADQATYFSEAAFLARTTTPYQQGYAWTQATSEFAGAISV